MPTRATTSVSRACASWLGAWAPGSSASAGNPWWAIRLRDTNLTAEQLWVVHDELDLPMCRMRIRRGGSGAGHNGVLSIIGALGTPEFVRFRVGIGKPARKGSQEGRHYVLGRFTRTEAARLPSIVDGVATALEVALDAGLEKAMERFNRAGSLGCEELA